MPAKSIVAPGGSGGPEAASSIVHLVFGMVALVFTAPLVGHATWHAWRDLIA